MMTEREQQQKLATDNAYSYYEFAMALAKSRQDKGITLEYVSEMTGISLKDLKEFERLESRPHLQDIMTYAIAVGARINFTIDKDYKANE